MKHVKSLFLLATFTAFISMTNISADVKSHISSTTDLNYADICEHKGNNPYKTIYQKYKINLNDVCQIASKHTKINDFKALFLLNLSAYYQTHQKQIPQKEYDMLNRILKAEKGQMVLSEKEPLYISLLHMTNQVLSPDNKTTDYFLKDTVLVSANEMNNAKIKQLLVNFEP